MTEPKMVEHADYTLAWICALPLELAAAEAVLDEHHTVPSTGSQSEYSLGKIAGHNIVLGCLPSGAYGTNSVAGAVARLLSLFPNVRYGVMVGIGGGAPVSGTGMDIRLGDVVVSKPMGTLGGVVQYDLGKSVGDGRLQRTGMLNQPPAILLTAVSRLESEMMRSTDDYISKQMTSVLLKNPEMEVRFSRPAQEDRLFRSTYSHPDEGASCVRCDNQEQVDRAPRSTTEPQIHYRIIASGNRVIKSALDLDEISQKFNAICFEMEAAGILNHLPCLVIRGICDYSDSHKNKEWQGYAALVAAICAKRLLTLVPVSGSCGSQISQIKSKGHLKERVLWLGGVGKTQVALELAYAIRDQDPARSIFWIPSTKVEAVEQAFRKMAQLLNLGEGDAEDIKSRVKNYISAGKAGSWLLIIDNADDPDRWVPSETSQGMKAFLPSSQGGFILFTSRNQGLVSQLVGPDVIQLSEMDNMTAVDLLKASLIRKDLAEDATSTSALASKLCGLPLALTQAASFINENVSSLKTYLSLLEQQEENVVELLGENFEDEHRYPETENPVSSTWLVEHLLSIRILDVGDRLTLWREYLPHAQVVLEQSEIETDGNAKDDLAEQVGNSEALLLRTLTSRQLKLEEDDPKLLQSRGRWKEADKLLVQHPDTLNRQWKEAEELQIQVSGLQKATLGLQHPATLLSMANLAATFLHQGRLKEAESLEVEVLALRKSILGPDHPSTLKRRWEESKELDAQVLDLRRAILRPKHPDTLMSLGNLAASLWDLGQLEEAEELFVEELELETAILGPEHPNTLSSMANLGSIYYGTERCKEAGELEAKVLELRKAILGDDHPDTLLSMANLAATLHKVGKSKEAEELSLQTLLLQNTKLGPEHPETLMSMANVAALYRDQGLWEKAEESELELWRQDFQEAQNVEASLSPREKPRRLFGWKQKPSGTEKSSRRFSSFFLPSKASQSKPEVR
ncbi:hypothetical protein BJY04DRAFT_226883 [Aspergillus karnatakaensis]|uniref:uncharacterized protein n=1 Tax=Aspergillus karnatakaensis TaxID=1810916 RepID=UPI003CCD57F3